MQRVSLPVLVSSENPKIGHCQTIRRELLSLMDLWIIMFLFLRYVHLPPYPLEFEAPDLVGVNPLLKVKGGSIEDGFEVHLLWYKTRSEDAHLFGKNNFLTNVTYILVKSYKRRDYDINHIHTPSY